MGVAVALRIVDGRELDLAEDDGPVRRRRAAHLHEIVADAERDEVLVRHARGARPHLGLVRVPVVPGLEDLGLDGGLDDLEGVDRVVRWGMRRVEVECLVRGCSRTGFSV